MKDSIHRFRPEVIDYLHRVSLRKPPGLDDLMAATREKTDLPQMMTDPEQGQFLGFLIQMLGAKRIVEVGVFTGVGTLWMAHAAGPDATLHACDISDEYPAIGEPYWQAAGVRDRIDLHIGPAQQSLDALRDEIGESSVDFVYIDADKEAYGTYYEQSLHLLRPGGVVALDNMLQGGRVADEDCDDGRVVAIRKVNETLHVDERVDVSFVPVCDGLYLARKR